MCSCVQTQHSVDNCLKKRGAWDFGSGIIKFKAARVNVCKNKIISVLFYKTESVGFKEDLSQSSSKVFSKVVQNKALKFIDQVLKESHHLQIESHKGVATAAFREAKNAQDLIGQFNRKYQLNIEVITQDQEALLGVLSAGTHLSKADLDYTVWDIGGGSQQITIKSISGYKTYKSKWASVSFKNLVANQIKKNKKSKSPNPLTIDEFNQATTKAKILAEDFKFPTYYVKENDVKNKDVKKIKQPIIYGIGGVHAMSIKSRLQNNEFYTQEDLLKMSKSYINKSDQDIGGKYASTEVTNIALVLGTMKGLGFKKVHPLKVGLVEGVLVSAYF